MTPDCIHWRDCNIQNGGCCDLKKYKKPSFGVCVHVCQAYTGARIYPVANVIHRKSRPCGLGDLIALVLTKIGLKKRRRCGCHRRQAKLNRMFPFPQRLLHGVR